MKKVLLISFLLFFTGLNGLMAQRGRASHVNPIPTFNYLMTDKIAEFQELGIEIPTREKRDMQVEVKTSSRGNSGIFATVWIYKLNGSQILGPFIVHCDELLSVPIDNKKWGVIIQSAWDLTVSVWTGKGN